MSATVSSFFSRPPAVFVTAIALRAVLLVYGHFHDQHSALKYTDIDYFVFTGASRYVAWHRSPYLRDTYRYTPLLAWLLLPTTWGGWWFDFGKILFAASDIVAGWLIYSILRSQYRMPVERALKFASIWLLNPMVAQISTRGSSEGLLTVMVMALLWAAMRRNVALSGFFLGLAVHFKIYPFIYGVSILWWLDQNTSAISIKASSSRQVSILSAAQQMITSAHINFVVLSVFTFLSLNLSMFYVYGAAFLEQTYLYHLIRSDHRHNFSVYNMLLYLNASPEGMSGSHPETLAFLPQLFLSAVAIPLILARRDLPSCMLAQTFAFVTFNKVCTSQYFLWYIAFLPFYLPNSTMLKKPRVGITALSLWILGQLFWLQQGYQLEFLARSTFFPGLWSANMLFFLINCWLLGLIVTDIRRNAPAAFARSQGKSN